MKKVLLFAAFAVFAFTGSQAQNMKAGVSLALPVGDAGDASSFGVQGDFAYLFDINDAFKVGPMASLFYYNGKDYDYGSVTVEGESYLFLPLGGSARFLLEEFFFGADLGYGIGLSPDGNDGGFFFRPKAGYNFGNIAVVLSYSGISRKYTYSVDPGYGLPGYSVSDTSTFGSINAGVEFSF